MNPIFSGLSLVVLYVLARRLGLVTKWRATRRLGKQTRSDAFWTGFTPKPNGMSSPTTAMADVAAIVVVDYCDRHPSARATYITFKVDPSLILTLCDHCTHKLVDGLVAAGFEMMLIPGVRQAVPSG